MARKRDISTVCNDLLTMAKTADPAIKAAGTLDDKIRMQRLKIALEKAALTLRPFVFDFEDAQTYTAHAGRKAEK